MVRREDDGEWEEPVEREERVARRMVGEQSQHEQRGAEVEQRERGAQEHRERDVGAGTLLSSSFAKRYIVHFLRLSSFKMVCLIIFAMTTL